MMTSRLPAPSAPPIRTLVLACAEEGAYAPAWRELLRDNAIVLRTHDREVVTFAGSPLAAALAAHPIERVIVLTHVGCREAAGELVEPAQNTAAIRAFCRYAHAAHRLAARRARGEIDVPELAAKLSALVGLANLEACPELHAALRRGKVRAHALVYDPATSDVERFDGATFHPVDADELDCLLAGTAASTQATERDFEDASTAFSFVSAPPVQGAHPLGGST